MISARLVVFLGVAAVLFSCGDNFDKAYKPILYLELGSNANPEEFRFAKIGAKDPAVRIPVRIFNTGEKELVIDKVELLEGGNAYIQIEWSGSVNPDSFPVVIEPDLTYPSVEFVLVYDPEEGVVDINTSTLQVVSNDPEFKSTNWEYNITLGIEAVGPAAQINRTSISFHCVSGCTTEQITIENDGTDILTVSSIDYSRASAEYAIPNPPNLPAEVKRKGMTGYAPVTFTVRYCPLDDDFRDDITLVVQTNDFSNFNGGIIEVPIRVVQSPAILQFSTGSAFGYLDFAGEGGKHVISLYNKASTECDDLCPTKGSCCGCPIQVIGIDVTPQNAKDWYKAVAINTDGTEKGFPFAVKGGGGQTFEVTYARPVGVNEDMNGKVCVNYNAPIEGNRQQCFDMIATSRCDLTVGPISQVLHFGGVDPATVKTKPVVLMNSGSGVCQVSKVWLTDNWGGNPDADFGIENEAGQAVVEIGAMEVGPFGVHPIPVKYAPVTAKPSGQLHIQYVDPDVGEVTTVVAVKGVKLNDECALPVAKPGTPANYAGATAGTAMYLDGCGSLAGSCGPVLYESGYIWFLLGKPEGSASYLNEETTCSTSFTPDVAGEYEIGLMVYDNETFYQSDLATVTITVAAAE